MRTLLLLAIASAVATAAYAHTDADILGQRAAFGDAQWIGAPADKQPFCAQFMTSFQLATTFQLEEGSSIAGFYFGADDPRLMDRRLNILGMENKPGESKIVVELDATGLERQERTVINVYRHGYSRQDKPTPFRTFAIDGQVINKLDLTHPHRMLLQVVLGELRIWIDGKQLAEAMGRDGCLSPIHCGGDYIAFPVLGGTGLAMRAGQHCALSPLEVHHPTPPYNLITSVPWSASADDEALQQGMTTLRTTVQLKQKAVKRATIRCAARGIYDLRVNGRPIDNSYFHQEFTQYDKTQLFQEYSLTPAPSPKDRRGDGQSAHPSWGEVGGEALIEVDLGEGWWSGPITYNSGYNTNYWGDRQSFIARINIEYEDGEVQTVTTQPDTWQACCDGPRLLGSFFNGEIVAPLLSPCGPSWVGAVAIATEGFTNPRRQYAETRFVPSYGPKVQVVDTVRAKSVTEVRPGLYIYDFGQNQAAVPEIHFTPQPRGQQIRMRFAEVLYPDMPKYGDNRGMLMLENIRAAMATDIYVPSGRQAGEVFSPRMTFHGYRYMEMPVLLPLDSVRSLVLSSIGQLSAHYECSDTLVNRLWENIIRSMRSNMISIPTDCPQRNERMGWTGDINAFSHTATYLSHDVHQFMRRFMMDIRDTQDQNGRFPDTAPVNEAFGGLLWGGAGITLPYECWQQWGDTAIISENYQAMCRYIDYIEREVIGSDGYFHPNPSYYADLADWLCLEADVRKQSKAFIWECYYIYYLDMMQQMATAIGQADDATRFATMAKERRERVCTKLEQTNVSDMLTHYVLALAFDVFRDHPTLQQSMEEGLIRRLTSPSTMDDGRSCPPYSLLTGFASTAWINTVLSSTGHSDMAYRLLTQRSYPSWLYPVTQGATSIWERLNSYTREDGFGGNNSMNSFNHYAFGSVGGWLIDHSLGIRRDTPGFRHFILAPEADPSGSVTFARGHYLSPFGRIESSWRILPNGQTEYQFTVPKGTSATLLLPATAGKKAMKKELKPGHYKYTR